MWRGQRWVNTVLPLSVSSVEETAIRVSIYNAVAAVKDKVLWGHGKRSVSFGSCFLPILNVLLYLYHINLTQHSRPNSSKHWSLHVSRAFLQSHALGWAVFRKGVLYLRIAAYLVSITYSLVFSIMPSCVFTFQFLVFLKIKDRVFLDECPQQLTKLKWIVDDQ